MPPSRYINKLLFPYFLPIPTPPTTKTLTSLHCILFKVVSSSSCYTPLLIAFHIYTFKFTYLSLFNTTKCLLLRVQTCPQSPQLQLDPPPTIIRPRRRLLLLAYSGFPSTALLPNSSILQPVLANSIVPQLPKSRSTPSSPKHPPLSCTPSSPMLKVSLSPTLLTPKTPAGPQIGVLRVVTNLSTILLSNPTRRPLVQAMGRLLLVARASSSSLSRRHSSASVATPSLLLLLPSA